jgi:hypothetical protein
MDFNETLEILQKMEEGLTAQELIKLRDPVLRKAALDAALRKKNKKLTGNQIADFDETGKLIIKSKNDVVSASKIGATKIR